MTRWCIVPGCKTGNHRYKSEKHSVFSVPKDLERLKQWEEAIPGNIKLRDTHVVCDKHFEKDVIIRHWIHRDSSGQIVAQVPYKHPRLSDDAVPSIFGANGDTNTKDVDGSVDSSEAVRAESPEPTGSESSTSLREHSPQARRADSPVEMEYIDCSKPEAIEDPTEYEFVATFKDSDSTVANGSNTLCDKSGPDAIAVENASSSALPIVNSKNKILTPPIEVVDVESDCLTKCLRIPRYRKLDPPPDLKKNPFAVFSTVSIDQHSNSAVPMKTVIDDLHTSFSSEAAFVPNLRKKTFAVSSTVANSQLADTGTRVKRRYSRVESESDDTTPIRSAITDSLTRLTGSRGDQTASANSVTSDELSCTIPPSWGVADLPRETGQLLVFSYSVTRSEDGIYLPVTQRSVTLDAEKNIGYFVYGRRVNAEETILDRMLDSTESLSNILLMFQWMSICNGLGNVMTEFIPGDSAYLDYVQIWRDNDCALLSSKKRCDCCAELRRRILMETARVTGRHSRRRGRKFLTPSEKLKLSEIRKMNRLERRKVKRAELRSQQATEEPLDTEIDEEALVHEKAETLDDDCSESYELAASVDDNEG